MQRSIINYQPVVPILLLFALVIYESITSIYTFLSPLSGVVFLYLVTNIKNKEKIFINVILFLYLVYVEIDRGLVVFSSLILFLIYYEFIHRELVISIGCKNCLKAVIISFYYIGIYLVNLIISLIFDLNLPIMDITYIIYLITDIFVVLVNEK